MTVSYRSAPLAGMHMDQWAHFTPAYCIPPGTPAGEIGGGGTNSLVAMIGGTPRPVRPTSSPFPGGLGYPAAPTLTGSETWFPTGFHAYSRVKYSKTYGVVVTGMAALDPGGAIVSDGHACFNSHEVDPTGGHRKWRYMGRQANDWFSYFEYDWAANRDLVVPVNNDDRINVLNGSLAALHAGTIPTVGTQVWIASGSFVSGGRRLTVPSGHNPIYSLPWRNEFWIWQQNINTLYRINLTTGGWEDITIPAAVWDPNTMGYQYMCPDPVSRRMIFMRLDLTASPDTSQNGVARYPALFWAVDPANPSSPASWTFLGTSTRKLNNVSAANLRALLHVGGSRYFFLDPWNNTDVCFQTPFNVSGLPYQRTLGGGYPVEFYIKETNRPRTLIFARTTIPATNYSDAHGRSFSRRAWNAQKHSDMAYNPLTGRMWHAGGDVGGLSLASSGNAAMVSFSPTDIAGMQVEISQPATSSHTPHFKLTDQCGIAWRPADSCFWFNAAQNYPDANRISCPGWEDVFDSSGSAAQHAAWLAGINAAYGTSFTDSSRLVWRVNPVTKVLTPFEPQATGYPATLGAVWTHGESRKSFKWDCDPTTDRICQISRNLRDAGGGLVQDEPVCEVYNPSANTFESAACSFDEANNVSISGSSQGDYSTMDPANGRVYFYDYVYGYVFRVDVRAGTYTRNSKPHFHTRRVCTMVPGWRTINRVYMKVANGVLFLILDNSSGRVRLFSFKDDGSETQPTEHNTPPFLLAKVMGRYQSGAEDRLMLVGSGGGNPVHPSYTDYGNDVWTVRF